MYLAFKWHIKLRNWLRIEGKNYLCERSIALYKYRKGIVWITLQADTNLVKHAIKLGSDLTSLQLEIIVYSRIYIFFPFKWRIKLRNRLRIQREKIIYMSRVYNTVCKYKFVWITEEVAGVKRSRIHALLINKQGLKIS